MRMKFTGNGTDFSATREAEKYIREQGWSVGSMQRGAPRAIYKDDSYVAKWRNLTPKDRAEADGMILAGDGRHGPVIIEMKEPTQ